MRRIEKSIVVNRPLRMVYDQWTQFEEFPKFMHGVEEVRQIDDRTLFWRARIAGKEEAWTAQIVDQKPDSLISWRRLGGAENFGVVEFHDLRDGRTLVTWRIEYRPRGLVEWTGSMLGVVAWQVRADLERFRRFIESRPSETGAWRGEIRPGGQVREPAAPLPGSSTQPGSPHQPGL